MWWLKVPIFLDFFPCCVGIEENTIQITKSLQHKASGDIVTPPKTGNGIRTITMPGAIMQEIKDYTHKIYGIKPSDRVFTFTKSLIRGN